jgi:hypothetical protein
LSTTDTSGQGGAWINVSRGFVDERGCVYDNYRRPLQQLPKHGYY